MLSVDVDAPDADKAHELGIETPSAAAQRLYSQGLISKEDLDACLEADAAFRRRRSFFSHGLVPVFVPHSMCSC